MEHTQILQGNTLRVYLYMLRERRPVGVREIMRALGLSSPSLAHYHINKLLNAKLIKQVNNKYMINKPIKIGIAKYFVIVSGRFLPRFSIYAGILSALLVFEFILISFNLMISLIFAIFATVMSLIIMCYETYNFWKEITLYLEQREKI
mgnify:CR=1 FL=1